jgi:hypothetical protein
MINFAVINQGSLSSYLPDVGPLTRGTPVVLYTFVYSRAACHAAVVIASQPKQMDDKFIAWVSTTVVVLLIIGVLLIH